MNGMTESEYISPQAVGAVTKSIALLQTGGAVRNTEEVIVIRGHLLRAIEGMKSHKFKRSNNIAFDALYEKLDVFRETLSEAMYKKKTHTIRQHVEAILTGME